MHKKRSHEHASFDNDANLGATTDIANQESEAPLGRKGLDAPSHFADDDHCQASLICKRCEASSYWTSARNLADIVAMVKRNDIPDSQQGVVIAALIQAAAIDRQTLTRLHSNDNSSNTNHVLYRSAPDGLKPADL